MASWSEGSDDAPTLATADAVRVEYRDDIGHWYEALGWTRITIKPVCRED